MEEIPEVDGDYVSATLDSKESEVNHDAMENYGCGGQPYGKK